MNNDELNKKIEGILQEEIEYVVVCGSSVKNVCIEHIADALIAAGIGDVKEAERRAAKAERALVMSCANMVKDEKSDVNIEWVIRVLYYKYLIIST